MDTDCEGERLERQDYQSDQTNDTKADCSAECVNRKGLAVAVVAQTCAAVGMLGETEWALVKVHCSSCPTCVAGEVMLAQVNGSSRKYLALELDGR